MIYQSRKRKYTSRKEKIKQGNLFLKRILVFVLITAGLLTVLRWQMVVDWVKVFFY